MTERLTAAGLVRASHEASSLAHRGMPSRYESLTDSLGTAYLSLVRRIGAPAGPAIKRAAQDVRRAMLRERGYRRHWRPPGAGWSPPPVSLGHPLARARLKDLVCR